MSDDENNQPRKRGRPPGKNRPALTEDQKRARNAQLERVRRGEIADETSNLATEMRAKPKIKLAELLAENLTHLISEQSKESVEELEATNQALRNEIQKLKRIKAELDAARAADQGTQEPSPSGVGTSELLDAASSDLESPSRTRLSSEQQPDDEKPPPLLPPTPAPTARSSSETEPETSPPHLQPTDRAEECAGSVLSPEVLRDIGEQLGVDLVRQFQLEPWPPDDDFFVPP
ncbi:unnamed protein product [Chilo suppressalis]|uniref:BHLH domain-containing protein n=1 Tax=Chilo suppressalis TaxID=168631 RepID=A0ABN8AY91_CHISP|nr:unnamed protein product [Chilo suppressalis]